MIINGYTIVPRSNLSEANLRWANLRKADLREANLRWADLRGANLRWANLRGADLRWANLRGADLSEADLSEADLSKADLREANLREANLRGANLRWADLSEADLSKANLSKANLRWANLSRANLSRAVNVPTIPETIIVPEGELIVYKKVSNGVAKLRIPTSALRSNATTRKCRASRAFVLECPEGAHSRYDPTFKYYKGCFVEPREPFDMNRWNECGSGIHFFLTREEAENY